MSIRSVTVPPSMIRSNWLASVIAAQTPPSASSAMPSGGPSSPSAKTRRSDSDPSAPMVNAVSRLPVDSATISVVAGPA